MNDNYQSASADIFHELVKQISNHSLQLASLPDIVIKVNQVLDDDRKGVLDVAKVIQNEVALSTRIIHIANSPAIRGNKQITSISDAVNRLGMELVKNLAICVTLKDRFVTKNPVHKELMQHAMATSIQRSVLGMMISKYLVKTSSPEVALISGLVSQLGQTVIIKYIDNNKDLKAIRKEQIIEILNQYGEEVSELILSMWGFPPAVLDAMFSKKIPDIANPMTNFDVYALSSRYLDGADQEQTDIFQKISQMIEEHREEFESTKSLIA